MNKIAKTHEEVLKHFLKLQKKDNTLFFAPRKINNKGRLDKGYWFLGDDHYLHLSFWNGEDEQERIHNIGFVILKDGTTYIELCAQKSIAKAAFLEKIVTELGGFRRISNKNKWNKEYQGKNYLENLDDFIQNTKPVIDQLIKSEKPEGIKFIDQDYYNKYCRKILNRRENQQDLGTVNKLSRICWNTENWKFPSGSKGKPESGDDYVAANGFGHEEWLFDRTKIIDGYHYAFLQPLHLKSDKHVDSVYHITLFTINNLNKRYYAGEIKNVECISKTESERVYNLYKQKGWLEEMKKSVKSIGANYKEFEDTKPQIFCNIRFRFKDVSLPDDLFEIDENDVNITTTRYKLLPRKTDIEFATENEDIDDHEGNKRNTKKRKKVFKGECEYDPYHDIMQNALQDLLKSELYNYKKVYIEKDRVDLKATTKQNTWHYFELKTDNPKQSIRKALGQILEYACFPDTIKAEKLIIIADREPDEDVKRYLNHIRNSFRLPVFYRYFDLETNFLSKDY